MAKSILDDLAMLTARIELLERRLKHVERFLEAASGAEVEVDPLEARHQRNLERLREQ